MERIEDLKKRALRIIWELRTTKGNELAEAMKPHRIQRIEQPLEALKSHAEQPSAPAEQRNAASNAVALSEHIEPGAVTARERRVALSGRTSARGA